MQSASNGWYFNLNNGNTNNNNKNTSYYALPCAECTERFDRYFVAERECFMNKKSKWAACKSHYNLSKMWELIEELESGDYSPKRSLCFIVSYPTYREIFASEYLGRVVHHLVAPYIIRISEQVHMANGDVTHGNRRGHSALTAAMQIQSRMRQCADGVVFKYDISGFFMSISRKLAYEVFCRYERMYRQSDIPENERLLLMRHIEKIVFNDPTKDCIRRCDISEWENIPSNKTLFNKDGKGLPIGNYPSQLLAVLLLAILDEQLHISHFVDDFCGIVKTSADAHRILNEAKRILESIELHMHPTKIYIQPVHHGVKFCGYVIYPDRIYISNRTRSAAIQTIDHWLSKSVCVENAEHIAQSFNSYTGIMSHARSYNIQCDLMNRILQSEFAKFLVFQSNTNHISCRIRQKYTYKSTYHNDIQYINSKQYGSNSSRKTRRLSSR